MPPRKSKGNKRSRESSSGKELVLATTPRASSRSNELLGPKGTSKNLILPGLVLTNDMNGSDVWALCEHQGWLNFFQMQEVVCPDLVKAFYSNVEVKIFGDEMSLDVVVNGEHKYYTHEHFRDDFEVRNRGYSSYITGPFPDDNLYVRLVKRFNHGKVPPIKPSLGGDDASGSEVGKERKLVPYRGFLTGEEYLCFKLVRDGILQTNNKDLSITHNELMVFSTLMNRDYVNLPVMIAHHIDNTIKRSKSHTLPFGMLITRIMKGWNPARRIVDTKLIPIKLSNQSCGNFKLSFDSNVGKWKTEAQIKEDGISCGESMEIPVDEGTSNVGNKRTSRKNKEDRIDLLRKEIRMQREEARTNLRVQSENEKKIIRNQSRLGKAMSTLMKAFLCSGKNEPVDEVALREEIEIEEASPYMFGNEEVQEDDDGDNNNEDNQDDASGDDSEYET